MLFTRDFFWFFAEPNKIEFKQEFVFMSILNAANFVFFPAVEKPRLPI